MFVLSKYLRLFFLTIFISLFYGGCTAPTAEFTENTRLNRLVTELYLQVDEHLNATGLRLVLTAQMHKDEPCYDFCIKDTLGNSLAISKGNPMENYRIIRFSECDKSGVSGYMIVDRKELSDVAKDSVSINDKLKETVFDLSCSPTINRFVHSKNIYVSSSQGKDSNTGLSETEPLQSIKVALYYGKNILLKCDDVFYESVSLDGISLSSYGKGGRPIVSGWKRLKKEYAKSAWQEGELINNVWHNKKGTQIWRLDMTQPEFEGMMSSPFKNNIGLIFDNETKQMYGHKCQFLYKNGGAEPVYSQNDTYLKNNFDFCQCSKINKINSDDYKYLYMKLDHNPGIYDFSFSTYATGFVLKNANVENVRIEGFGCHGIACGSNVSVTNCEIEYIGGSQYIYDNPVWNRLGNGIEFYVSSTLKNAYVANNLICHTFDCATTIQASNRKDAWAENIVFEKNKIMNCRQAFEHFLNNTDSKTGKILDYVNCKFVGNVCLDLGINGFSSPELRDACILSYEKEDKKSIEISNNIFFGSNYYCGRNYSKHIHDNEVYVYEDQYLNDYHFATPYSVIKANAPVSVLNYKKRVSDKSNITVMKRGSASSKNLRSKVLKMILK